MKNDLFQQEVKMSLQEYISEDDIVEEIRLLADSMSTHGALARKMGISDSYLSDILNGRRYPGATVCKFLGVMPVRMYKEVKK